jgi:hypothetical protein
MTAEIAILNKTAVALAADSAVTISVGDRSEKTFDAADKLFELSCDDPIGIMVNDNLQFVEIPLQVIIKEYRTQNKRYERVQDAAFDFLRFLVAHGKDAPPEVRKRSVVNQCRPLVETMEDRVWENLRNRDKYGEGESFSDARSRFAGEEIEGLTRAWNSPNNTEFLDDIECELDDQDRAAIRETVEALFAVGSQDQREQLTQLLIDNVGKHWFAQPSTGIVVAGFGRKDKFPTLVEFEIFGMIGGALKFRPKVIVDIDRNGDRGRVVPFAQSEMVERFIYGLDSKMANEIRSFCAETAPNIANRLLALLEIDDESRTKLFGEAIDAEHAFVAALQTHLMGSIGEDSKREIENMVEFMPKAELARLAEELVNLTSIKHRASRGMATVGGPIDVAVISKAEGFVWVKRKHYFPAELNARYFDRIREVGANGETGAA